MIRETIDVQVNGYAGVDFNSDDLTPEGLHLACERLQHDGVASILATVITAELSVLQNRIRRLAHLRDVDPLAKSVIKGVHVEGPFLNGETGYIGAHPPEHARPATWDAMQGLLDAGAGLVKLVTLAPEQDQGMRVIRELARRKIVVSAGHSDASLDQLRAALDAGLIMYTHLGNGCPVRMHRHDNIIWRVLSLADRIWPTVILDGVHVPFPTLRSMIKVIGTDRVIGTTDCISAAGLGKGRFMIGTREAIVGDDLTPRFVADTNYFAGSALTMPRAAENLQQQLGLDEVSVKRILVDNARTVVKQITGETW